MPHVRFFSGGYDHQRLTVYKNNNNNTDIHNVHGDVPSIALSIYTMIFMAREFENDLQ